MEYVIILFRTLFFYILIIFIYRFMGKREVGQLGIIDLIVSILIAEIVTYALMNTDKSIAISILPAIFLMILQIIFAYISLKVPKSRKLFDGNPSVIIDNGRINFKEMLKQRYNLDDLLSQLREKNIKSIEEVEYAVLETNGKLSVFLKKDNKSYPFPLILDGKVDEDTLKKINKDKKWLSNILKKEYIELNEIFYAFYTKDNLYIITNEELL